jgi:hypothetical protein
MSDHLREHQLAERDVRRRADAVHAGGVAADGIPGDAETLAALE